MTKTEFILSQPTTMTAQQVMAAAAAKGLVIAVNTIHAVRSKARKGKARKRKAMRAPRVEPYANPLLRRKVPVVETPRVRELVERFAEDLAEAIKAGVLESMQ